MAGSCAPWRIGGTAETYDSATYTFTDRGWHYVSVSHAMNYAHTSVRGLVRGSGKVKFDVDWTSLW